MTYKFNNTDSTFFKHIKQSVDNYFQTNKIHRSGNGRLYFKSSIQVLSAVALYVVLVFFTPPTLITIGLCALLGFNLAIIGFNVMHEGGHQSFSKYPWINAVSAYFLNILGGVSYFWKVKHNINHHTYTNVEGMDSDIDVKPFMRLHAEQPWRSYHRYQHIYGLPLYSLSYLAWIFYEDFVKYFSKRVSASQESASLPLREHFIFWLTKAMYIVVYCVIPIIMTGFFSWLIGFLVITLVCGLTTSTVFQLAHVVEGTHFHNAAAEKSEREWAVHQVLSTSNFATRSRTLHWLLGGLNFQIEHHLFPRISHMHYPSISVLVKRACSEAGITYNEYSSMASALLSHLMHLKKLGSSRTETT